MVGQDSEERSSPDPEARVEDGRKMRERLRVDEMEVEGEAMGICEALERMESYQRALAGGPTGLEPALVLSFVVTPLL